MGVWEQTRGFFVSFLLVLLFLSPFSIAISGYDVIFFNRFDFTDTDLNRIKKGAYYLRSVTNPQDIILTVDDPDHVFIAGRYSIPQRINRHDSYTDTENVEILQKLARYNTPMFLGWLENDVTVFVFQRDIIEDRLGAIGGGKDITPEVKRILEERFEFVGSVENVYPLKSKRGSGIMEVYRKKE